MTVTQDRILPGTTIFRQTDGIAGTDEIVVYHDGTHGYIKSGLGNLILGTLSFPAADGTNGQAIITNGAGVLSFATFGTGSLTTISTGTGLTGGPISNTGTVSIAAHGVTSALFRQSAATTLVGNPTGSLADVTDITLGSTLAFVAGALQSTAMSGDVSTSANSFVTTIGSNKVGYSKIQKGSAATLVGNPGTASADVSEITLGTGMTFTGTTLAMGTSGVTAGTYGDATHTNTVTVDVIGRVTSISTNLITPAGIGAPAGSGTSTGTNTGDQTITLTGDIAGSGTGSFATTLATVNANVGTFGDATHPAIVTVNAKGLVTAISTGATALGTGSVTSVATGTGLTGGPVTNSGTISMATSGVTAGTYGSGTNFPQIVVDAIGRVTSATTVALGSIASQASSNVSITGGTITGLPTPTNASDAATKNYVDNATAGLTAKGAVRLASVGSNIAATYNNGASGVGATLTLTATGAMSLDGSAVIVGDRILVKDQTNGTQNGIYSVTVAGSAGTSAVLTRTTDFNSSTNVVDGSYTVIEEGTVNKGTLWLVTSAGDQTYTIGTTAIAFTELTVANQSTTLTGDITGAGAGTVATTLATVNSNVGTFGNTTNIPTITVNGKGLVTAISNTAITYGTGSVTSITAGTDLTGGTITNTGTINLATQGGVTAGTFGNTTNIPQITVNAKGIITAITNTSITYGTGSVTSVATGTGLTGGPVTNAGTVSIATNGVSNALFRTSVANSLVGNSAGTTGNVADVLLGATLVMSSGSLQTTALSGDVTTSANSFATTIANNAVTTAKINASAVTYAKIQNETASTLLGNPGTAAAAPSEITIGGNLVLSTAGTLNAGTNVALLTTSNTAGQVYSGAQRGTVSALTTTSGTIPVDMSVQNNFSIAMTANATINNPTNVAAGQSGNIAITQNASSAFTLAFAANWISVNGTTPTISTTLGAQNLLSYYAADSTHIWYSVQTHGIA